MTNEEFLADLGARLATHPYRHFKLRSGEADRIVDVLGVDLYVYPHNGSMKDHAYAADLRKLLATHVKNMLTR